MSNAVSGVYCAAATPLNADLSIDTGALASHCAALLAQGCNGIAPMGTTGEALSFSAAERMAAAEALISAGIPPERVLLGVGALAIPDAVALTRHALSLGVRHVLLLPPFYYPPAGDDGLYAAFVRIIDEVAAPELHVMLYHIPHLSGVAIGHDVIARLREAFHGTVVGIKDSSGDWENLEAMTARFDNFSIMTGADPLLGRLVEAGGAGCITGAANVMAPLLVRRFGGDMNAQDGIEQTREITTRYGAFASIKALIAAQSGYEGWMRVRPPLLPLAQDKAVEIAADFAAVTV